MPAARHLDAAALAALRQEPLEPKALLKRLRRRWPGLTLPSVLASLVRLNRRGLLERLPDGRYRARDQ